MYRNIFFLLFIGVGFFGDAWGAKGDQISESLKKLVHAGRDQDTVTIKYEPSDSDRAIYPLMHTGELEQYDFSGKLAAGTDDGGACGPSALGLSRQDAIDSIKEALGKEKDSDTFTDLKKSLMYGLLQSISDKNMEWGQGEKRALEVIYTIIERGLGHWRAVIPESAKEAKEALDVLFYAWPKNGEGALKGVGEWKKRNFSSEVRGAIAGAMQTLMQEVPEVRKIFFNNIDKWIDYYSGNGVFFESALVMAAGLAKGCGVAILWFNREKNQYYSLSAVKPPEGSNCMAYVRRIGQHFVSLFPKVEIPDAAEEQLNVNANANVDVDVDANKQTPEDVRETYMERKDAHYKMNKEIKEIEDKIEEKNREIIEISQQLDEAKYFRKQILEEELAKRIEEWEDLEKTKSDFLKKKEAAAQQPQGQDEAQPLITYMEKLMLQNQ